MNGRVSEFVILITLSLPSLIGNQFFSSSELN